MFWENPAVTYFSSADVLLPVPKIVAYVASFLGAMVFVDASLSPAVKRTSFGLHTVLFAQSTNTGPSFVRFTNRIFDCFTVMRHPFFLTYLKPPNVVFILHQKVFLLSLYFTWGRAVENLWKGFSYDEKIIQSDKNLQNNLILCKINDKIHL